jgi:hypothetical protein
MGGIKIKPEIVKFELSSNISTGSNYFHTGKKFFTFLKQNLQRILPEFSKYICIDTCIQREQKIFKNC